MSLILDALRRMEQDRMTRRQAAAGIRPEVLRYRGRPQKQPSRLLPAVLVCLILLAAGLGASLLFREGSARKTKKTADREIKSSPAPEVQPATLPTSAVTAPTPVPLTNLPPASPASPPAAPPVKQQPQASAKIAIKEP